MSRTKILIMGAAGRDFHNFNVCFRDDPSVEVVAFTATQIPGIEGRRYPPELAGTLYPEGIPIYDEAELPRLIAEHGIQQVYFSYSDVAHAYVMHKAAQVVALGADFSLLGTRRTQLKSRKPVVSVGAVRTGCGKSQATRYVARALKELGWRVVVVRHPMPYGDLQKQVVQRFASHADLELNQTTIEEREEFEPHLDNGHIVYAGVDYALILACAEEEADIILWDGGNNDLPFFASDLHIVIADPHRPGHELTYYPGEANARLADAFVLNKVDTANYADIQAVRENLERLKPSAPIFEAASPLFVEAAEQIRGKRVLVIEDGPTLTHGEMPYGAGVVAARRFGAAELIDPRPYAVGSLQDVYVRYPHIGALLPAMGYGAAQIAELEATIAACNADLVLTATPIDLRRIIKVTAPLVRVRYELQIIGAPTLADLLAEKFGRKG
ncbi:MAG: GTPase [Candidatus Thermofonsia Clade 1 bacterium]|uniref:GTPase n=1 Tax=Candidatus Thermofonsia Clade 1 bacterium TaxID=2364210 RepID=A0A2M8PEE4_9CHLR|nr:MAG: GTPase [Candidatus Thermofonsia Clade 1 bacterium]RMF49911.1 MAG: GTPase [Chloroflexota bacterium]